MNTLTLNPSKSALLIVDLQNMVVGMSLAPHSTADVVSRSAKLASAFREKGGAVVYITVDLANFVKVEADAPGRDPNSPLPPASALELSPEAGFQEGDLHVAKRYWGAFIGTDLESQLRSRGIETVVITGIATNMGVESTGREGAALGFNVVLVEDAMTTLSAEAHEFAVTTIFPRMGRVRSTEQVIAGLV